MNRLLVFLLILCSSSKIQAQQEHIRPSLSITAVIDSLLDSASIEISPYRTVGIPEYEKVFRQVINRKVHWKIEAKMPYKISLTFLPRSRQVYFLAEPGDDITVIYNNKKVSFLGKGSEKIFLKLRLDALRDSLDFMISNKVRYNVKSLEDFLEWNRYLNARLKLSLSIIENYKSRISSTAYIDIRNSTLDRIADDRSDKFGMFTAFARKNGFSNSDISLIYDSTYGANTKVRDLPSLSGNFFGTWRFIQYKVARKYNFEMGNWPLNSKISRTILNYNTGASTYSGLALQKFKADFLTGQVIHDLGFTPQTDSLLLAYYAEPGYQEYKKFVRNYELKSRALRAGRSAPEFSLTNDKGQKVLLSNLKGKVVLMDFWFTGCVGCVQMTPALKKVEEVFRNDTNIVFLSISTDKNKQQWLGSIKEGKYTTGTAINLYTETQGNNHPIIKNFQVGGYPSLYLIDGLGNVVINPVPDPRGGNEQALTHLIKEQLVKLKDGPYVLSNGHAYYFSGSKVSKVVDGSLLDVETDDYGKKFHVNLQKEIRPGKTDYEPAEKLLALSDIEGNFDAFRKLLQSNGVIDTAYNWIFGNGHLVFAGDMFDRGDQVTECLWLIYSLEEKAKAAGGYVHFVLGNHEIMNLSGDSRYAKPKYIVNAKAIGKTYSELFNSESELGKWLRSKNIIEKIGSVLFLHGGFSEELLRLNLPLEKINTIARPYYDKDTIARKSLDKELSVLYSSKKSPFLA